MRRSSELGLVSAAAGLLAAATAMAGQPSAGRDTCFVGANVENFSAPSDHTIYLRTSSRETFRLDLMGECPGLTFRQSLGVEGRPASPWI